MTYFTPTNALPGSEEKIAVIEERYENGHPLFHPADRTCLIDSSEICGPGSSVPEPIVVHGTRYLSNV